MAKQHFYSRVPARMSLFNKMDSYDTFAHSDGISREFIEKELSAVCENKLTKEECELIKVGALPTAYCQFTAADGTLSQSAVTYIASDYTGERSSYMVHTLLLSEEEKAAHTEDADGEIFNADVFKRDLTDFDLTSFDARPSRDYPETDVPVKKASPASSITDMYDAGMIKRLIYALTGIACGKTKSLFLSFNSPLAQMSDRSLEFLNTVLQIFPYHMRDALSFVTYAGDHTKYTSFKIKCIPENTPEIPTAKGVTVKMDAKDYTGISDENIAANAGVVDFFFELLNKDDVRREFLGFCKYVTDRNDTFKKVTFKGLSDLILLFRSLSGFYDQQSVLPTDDAVYDFVCIYDKSRTALSDQYRARALKCLDRYPASMTAIPKNVFSKVANIYPTETAASKHNVMRVVLELIHTDAMREKLFSFIKANYAGEDSDTRQEIMENICRVYYGGFLQKAIIEFFTEYFENEPENIRVNMVERLLLTVRTPAVQAQVIDFVDKFYGIFTDTEKDKFYQIFFEMLPEADELSRRLADIVDAHIEDDRRQSVAQGILSAVESDEKRREPSLCGVLVTKCGFTESAIAEKVLGDWSNRKVLGGFIEAVCKKDMPGRIETVAEIWRAVPDMSPAVSERLLSGLSDNFTAGPRMGLFALADSLAELDSLKAEIPACADFVGRLSENVIMPNIISLIPTAFDIKRYPDGIDRLSELADIRPDIKNSDRYACINAYNEAVVCIKNGDAAALSKLGALEGKSVRAGAAEHLKRDIAADQLTDEGYVILNIAAEYLKSDSICFADAASALRDRLMDKPDADGQEADRQILSLILKTGREICLCGIPLDQSDILSYLNSFVTKYEKKGKRFLADQAEGIKDPADYVALINKSVESKTSSGGFFKRLFK